MYKDRKTKSVVRLLELAGRFNRLAKACPPQCSEGFYRMKDNALKKALTLAPEQFVEDSRMVRSGLVGMTHKPSNRRFHMHLQFFYKIKGACYYESQITEIA